MPVQPVLEQRPQRVAADEQPERRKHAQPREAPCGQRDDRRQEDQHRHGRMHTRERVQQPRFEHRRRRAQHVGAPRAAGVGHVLGPAHWRMLLALRRNMSKCARGAPDGAARAPLGGLADLRQRRARRRGLPRALGGRLRRGRLCVCRRGWLLGRRLRGRLRCSRLGGLLGRRGRGWLLWRLLARRPARRSLRRGAGAEARMSGASGTPGASLMMRKRRMPSVIRSVRSSASSSSRVAGVELHQVVLGARLALDRVRQRPLAPLVVAQQLSAAPRSRRARRRRSSRARRPRPAGRAAARGRMWVRAASCDCRRVAGSAWRRGRGLGRARRRRRGASRASPWRGCPRAARRSSRRGRAR